MPHYGYSHEVFTVWLHCMEHDLRSLPEHSIITRVFFSRVAVHDLRTVTDQVFIMLIDINRHGKHENSSHFLYVVPPRSTSPTEKQSPSPHENTASRHTPHTPDPPIRSPHSSELHPQDPIIDSVRMNLFRERCMHVMRPCDRNR